MVSNSGGIQLAEGSQLTLTANETADIEPGSPVNFTVTDEAGDPVGNANVTVGSETRTTAAENGSVTLPVEYADDGNVTATVSKEPEGGVIYQDDTVELDVLQPATLEYTDFEVDPSSVEIGESVSASANVTNVGDIGGEYNATLYVNGSSIDEYDTGSLDAGNTTSVSFTTTLDELGNHTLYIGDEEQTDATTVEKYVQVASETIQLGLDAEGYSDGDSVPTGESVTFVVTNETGGTVEDATVAIGEENGTTGADGTVELTVIGDGDLQATANKEADDPTVQYQEGVFNLTVLGPSNITYSDLEVPSAVEFESTETISVNVSNVGDQQGTFNATLLVNDTQSGQRDGTLEAGATRQLDFEYTFNTLGTRSVAIDDLEIDGIQIGPETVQVENESIDLHLAANDTTPFNGSVVQFTVTNQTAEGESIEGAQVKVDNASGETNDEGVVNLRVFGDGEITATATKDEEGIAYGDATLDLYVQQASDIVYSNISVDPYDPQVDEQVTINATVTNHAGVDRVYNATVFVDGEPIEATLLEGTENGTLGDEPRDLSFLTEFETAGDREISVGDAVLEGAVSTETAYVSVERIERQLNITANESEITAGQSVKFTVTEEGMSNVVENATVEVNGQQQTTSSDGTATFTISEGKEYTATADKAQTDRVSYGEDSVNIRVNDPADIQVTDVSPPDSIYTNESFTVAVVVENDGDIRGNETIDFTLWDEDSNVAVSDSQEVEQLGGDNWTTIQFTANLSSAGNYVVGVGDADNQTVVVEPAIATVGFTAPSSVTIGDDLTVAATVQNFGSYQRSKTVALYVDGDKKADKSVSVGEGATNTAELTWNTDGAENAGTVDVSIDDLDPQTVTLNRRTVGLQISTNATDRTVVNDTIVFNVTRDGTPVNASVRVAGQRLRTGEDGMVTTAIETAGSYTARAKKNKTPHEEFDDAYVGVTVREPANITVPETYLPSNRSYVGDNVTVFAVVENDGGVEGEIELVMRNGTGDRLTTQNVTLGAGSSSEVAVTTQFDAPADNVTLSVQNETAGTVTIDPQSTVVDTEINATAVTTDDTVRVNAIVENRGESEDANGLEVTFAAGNQEKTNSTGPIPSGDTITVSETFSFPENDTYDVTVNEGVVGTVTVAVDVAPLNLTVEESPVTAGTPLNFTVNRTDTDEGVDATLEIAGETHEVDNGVASVTLDEGGTYEVTATKEEDEQGTTFNSDSIEVVVNAPADISVTNAYRLDTQAYTGDNATIRAFVTNDGDLKDSVTINLTADGSDEVLDNATVTVPGGEQKNVTLNASFDTAGTRTLSAGDVEAGDVEFDPQTVVTGFTINRSSVTVDNAVTINATVRNRGSTDEDGYPVNLSVDGEADVANKTAEPDANSVVYKEFTRTLTEVGPTNISVNDLSPKSVLVTERVVDLSVNVTTPTPITTDDDVVFNVTNSSGGAVEDATIVASGQVLETNESGKAVATFASGSVSATVTKDGPDTTYNPASTEFTVNRPANIFVIGWDVTTDEPIYAGNEVDVDVTLLNVGGVEGEHNATLQVDDETVDNSTITVPAASTSTTTLTAQLNETGEQTLTVDDDLFVDQIDVQPAATVANYTVNTTALTTDEALKVQANVVNRGGIDDEVNVTFQWDGESETNTTEVEAGETIPVNFTTSFPEAGSKSVQINDLEPTGISVAAEQIDLNLTAEPTPTTVAAGETITFTVTDDENNLVEGARVTIGDQRVTTDEFGTVETSVREAGSYTATATKSGTDAVAYNRDTVDVTVTDPISVDGSIEFGTAPAAPDGGSTQTAEVEITNDGGRSVSLGSAEIRGDDASQFAITSMPSSVEAGGSTTVTVEYTPTTRGDVTATLRFRSDTRKNPVRSVTLNGTGVAPGITVNETSLSFGNLSVGETSTKTIEISNSGNDQLSVETGGSSPFEWTESNFTLDSGNSRDVSVTFAPTELGTFGARINIFSDDPFNGTVTVRASGTGLGGELAVSPSPVDGETDLAFGSVTNGTTATKRVLIENTGTANLNVTPTIEDDSNDEFGVSNATVDDLNDTEITLEPDESRFLTVSVTPTTDSPTANLTLSPDDGSKKTLELAATTVTPTIEIGENPADPKITFGEVAVGGSTSESLVIRNTGDATLEIDTEDAIPANEPFRAFRSQGLLPAFTTSITVPPNAERLVPVTFMPISPGEKTAKMTLQTNDPANEKVTVDLTGRAVETDLTGTPSSVDFGTIGQNDTVTETVTIVNDGNEELTGLRVTSKTGSGASHFQVGSVPTSLDAGDTAQVDITYAPTAADDHSASVTFEATGALAGSSQFAVSLSGEATPPEVAVSDETIRFGYVNTEGEEATETIQITNDGLAGTSLEVESVSLEDDDTDAYTITSDPTGETISSGAMESVDVDFDPTETGERTATLVIDTNDPDQATVEVPLIGVGSAPDAVADTGSISFGEVQTNATSDERVVEITNDGGENLENVAATLTDDPTNQFTITDGLGQDTLVPGASATVSVAASPDTTGVQEANLTISSNDPDGELDVELSADGIAPNLTVTSDFDGEFGDVRTGSSNRHSLTVNNDGNATLELEDPEITGNDAFTIVTGDSGIDLNPGESVTYAIAFTPTEEGEIDGTFVLDSNDRELTRDLNGTGVEANASLSNPAYNFGEVPADTTEETTLELSNDGNASLQITSVQVTGEDAGTFSVSGLSTGAIEADSSDTFTISTTPSVTGSASAQLEIDTAEPGTITASLGATGVEQDIELETQRVTFDRTRLGTTATTMLPITNDGNIPLNVTDLNLVGADSDQFAVVQSELTILPGRTKTVEVAFSPPMDDTSVQEANDDVAQTARLIVSSDDPDEGRQEVRLSGTGMTPKLKVTHAVQFGSTAIGDTSTRTVKITNDVSASAPIDLRAVAASGGFGGEFSAGNPGKTTLLPGESTTVTVSLTPQVAGPKYGSLNIITNDPRQPGASVFLSNSETIVTVQYGSALVDYENVQPGLQPDREFHPYPDADAEVIGTQPAVQTSDDFELKFEGQPKDEPFGASVNRSDYGAVRYVSATKSNITASELTNNTFTFRVSKATLGTETEPGDVELLAYNGSGYEPVQSGTTMIREEQTDYVYEATSDHLSQFAIAVENPLPDIQLSSPDLSVTETDVDTTVTVSLTVTNDGEAEGTETVALVVDGTQIGNSKTVTLGAGEEQTVTFDYTPTSEGEYDIVIGGQSAGTLTATVPEGEPDEEEPTETDTGPSPDEPSQPTQPADIDVTIEDGTASVSVSNAGANQPVRIEPGVTGEGPASPQLGGMNVTFTRDVESTSMSVSGDRGATPPVREDQDLGYFNVSHEFTDEDVGEVTFDFTVDQQRLEDREVAPEDVVLYRYSEEQWTALETTQVGSTDGAYRFEAVSPGLSVFAVSTVQAQEPVISVTDATLETTDIETGDSVDVTATIENTGTSSGTFVANLTVDGEVVADQSVTVAAGSTETVTFTRTFEEAGTYDLGVSGTTAGTLTVEEPSVTTTTPTTTTTETTTEPGPTGVGATTIVGVLAVFLIIIGGAYLYWRREQ